MKNILLTLLLATAFNLNAATVDINESTNPVLDTTFLDYGSSNLDVAQDLYWLNFSDLVLGDLTLGYSVDSNVAWFGPQDWRLPTYTEVYNLFDTFFEPAYVDSGDGAMVIDESSSLVESRNSWILGFGSNAEPLVGGTNPADAIITSAGLYLDELGNVQLMGVVFDLVNLSTTIYGPSYAVDFQTDLAYADYGTFMVYDAVVPVPAAVWLFGAGLIGLVGVARRKTAA